MKCEYCDQEIKENETVCSHCSAPVKQPLKQDEPIQQIKTSDVANINITTSNDENNKGNGNNKKNFIKILLPIIAVIVLIIGIGVIFSLNKKDEFKEKKENSSSSIFDYDAVPYAYADDSIIENSTKKKTTQSRTTEKKETTTRTYSTNQVTLPQTTRRTTQATITTKPTATTTQPVTTNKKISRTIMIYMVGSNLESEAGSATQDIYEMSQAYLDDYTNIYVYAGGSNKWQNDYISSTNNGIYQVKNGYIYFVADDGNKNMGLSSTLSGFINYIERNTNSDYYDLILWDHGGGPLSGFGNDEKTNDYLEMQEIERALKSTAFNKNNKLEFIGFDACLMASLEVALFLDDYADYLIASEEIEAGIGWYYNALENASSLDTISFAKQIINGFAQDNKIYESYYPNTPYTLSLIDLSNVSTLAETVNDSSQSLKNEMEKNYELYAKYRVDSLEFGKSTSTESFDLIDLYSFANNARIDKITTEIQNTVIYSSSNLKNAYGISIYFPFTNEDYISNYYLNYYESYKELSDYYYFLKDFMKIKTGTKRNDIAIEDNDLEFNKSNNQLSVTLSENEINNIAASQYVVFRKEDDGNYTPVYRGNNVAKVGNKLIAQYNKKLIYVRENGEEAPLQVLQSKTTNRGTLFLAPVILMNITDDFKVDSGYAQIYIKNDDIQFTGIMPSDDENDKGTTNQNNGKVQWQLGEWEFAHFTNYRYNILDENGHYTMNWKSLSQKYLFEVSPQKNKVEFILKDMDPNEEYYIVFNIKDYQGNITSSDLIKVS